MSSKSPFYRLFAIVKPQIPIISAGVIAEILKYIVALWLGLLGVNLLRMARAGEPADLLIPIGILILVLAVFRGLFSYLTSYLCHVGAYRLLASLRDTFYRMIEPLAPAALMQRRTGDIVSMAGNNVEALELFFAHTVSPLITAIIIPIIVFCALFQIHPSLAGTYAVITLCIACLPRLSIALNEKRAGRLRELLGSINSYLIDSIQGIREILAFSRADDRYDQAMKLNSEYHEEYGAYIRKNGIITGTFIFCLSGGVILMLIVSSTLASQGIIDSLSIPIVILFASVGFSSMANIVDISKQLGLTLAGAKRLFDLMDLVPSVQEPENPVTTQIIEPEISVEGVSFRYGNTEPLVLKDVSFAVPAGKTVAIVGMTGAGKTTISHLIMRFWDPLSGTIKIGGHDIRDFSLFRLREMAAMVTQDVFLLNASIRENIRIGRGNATDEEVIVVAKTARIHAFITSLPDGYDTLVGERGIRLSGGERQRIAIARALLKDAPILIMDEATSALDTCTEFEIREAIRVLSSGRTVLVIAHRLSTIIHADSILVIREGTIVESGTHRELLEKNGVYADLIAAQDV